MLPPLSHPLCHVLPQLCRPSLIWGLGAGRLPGPCSGKQDTTEHTWAEVKTSWAASAWQGSEPGKEGRLGTVCERAVTQGGSLQDLFTLSFCTCWGSVPKLQPMLCSAWGRRVHLWGGRAFLWPALIPALVCPRSGALCATGIASLTLCSATRVLRPSATTLACLVLDVSPLFLSLFDPTIGFSLPPLCDRSIFSTHA